MSKCSDVILGCRWDKKPILPGGERGIASISCISESNVERDAAVNMYPVAHTCIVTAL